MRTASHDYTLQDGYSAQETRFKQLFTRNVTLKFYEIGNLIHDMITAIAKSHLLEILYKHSAFCTSGIKALI
jgi:hypothetical protein